MMPPTSIDGTDITGATIDGTDVQEITVDGQTVFSAKTLPVAYSNLIAWYPFDSATYGGSNADDVTAIIGGSGDDTPYNGTFDSSGTTPTYQSSGGVTDINAGTNSGAFDFDGSNDHIRLPTNGFDWEDHSIALWAKADTTARGNLIGGKDGDGIFTLYTSGKTFENDNSFGTINSNDQANTWIHYCLTNDGSTVELLIDGDPEGTDSWPGPVTTVPDLFIGAFNNEENNQLIEPFDGLIDDVRIYNKRLISSEVSQIVANTPHP